MQINWCSLVTNLNIHCTSFSIHLDNVTNFLLKLLYNSSREGFSDQKGDFLWQVIFQFFNNKHRLLNYFLPLKISHSASGVIWENKNPSWSAMISVFLLATHSNMTFCSSCFLMVICSLIYCVEKNAVWGKSSYHNDIVDTLHSHTRFSQNHVWKEICQF